MLLEEIKALKLKAIEDNKEKFPVHILEMGLNMLYKEPVNLKEVFSQAPCEIFEIKNFNQDKTYEIGKNTSALIINSDEVFLNGSLENISFAKESFNLPIIARDYFLEEYQIYLSRIYQADGIIIEPNLINDETLEKISLLSLAMGIEPIFNIRTQSDIERLKRFDFASTFIFEDANLISYIDKSKLNLFYDSDNKENLVKMGIRLFIRILI
jgi:indole-3-glycerol phosphate synthase